MQESPSRRDWLLLSLQGIVAASVAVLLYPVARFLRPRKETKSGALEVVAPFQFNQLLKGEPKTQLPFDFGGKPCLVIWINDGRPDGVLQAFNAVCTHLECTVEYRADHKDIFCNCHNGVYDLNGRNVAGPPPRPLETYKVTRRGKDKEEIIVYRST